MNDKLIVPGELYIKAKEALPIQWIGMLFDTYDTNPNKNQRVVRLDTVAMCNPDNLTNLTNDIIVAHDTHRFSRNMLLFVIISSIAFLAYMILTHVDSVVYFVYLIYLAALGKYYITALYLELEKQKYAGSVMVEICNIVLIEHESNRSSEYMRMLNQLKSTPEHYHHLLNFVKQHSPDLYSKYTHNVTK